MSILALALAAGVATACESRVTVTFPESDAVFANPGEGGMTGNPQNSSPRFPYSVVYLVPT